MGEASGLFVPLTRPGWRLAGLSRGGERRIFFIRLKWYDNFLTGLAHFTSLPIHSAEMLRKLVFLLTGLAFLEAREEFR